MRDKKVEKLIKSEEKRQAKGLELIPSENYVSEDVLKANGSVFTNNGIYLIFIKFKPDIIQQCSL